MSYTLPKYGVCFGDVDPTYKTTDIKAAVETIAKHFNLIRTYDSMHSQAKYNTLMQTASDNEIDIILGIPNSALANFSGSYKTAKTYISNYLKNNAYQSDGTTPWSNLKCIIVGNETYGSDDKYKTYAPILESCVSNLITAIKSDNNLKDSLAVSIDFGPALHEDGDLSKCDFTGPAPAKCPNGPGKYDSSNIVNAMKAILNGGLSTPKMVFGNLYPFYAPFNSVNCQS